MDTPRQMLSWSGPQNKSDVQLKKMKLNNRTRILEKDTNIYVPDIADLV